MQRLGATSAGRALLASIQNSLLLGPAAIVFCAFFLLPLGRLLLIGASGPLGWSAYASAITDPRYLESLIATVALASATTFFTLLAATVSGVFLTRHDFPGRQLVVSLLTLPLAFPGVVIGFMVIMLAGRQGLIPMFT